MHTCVLLLIQLANKSEKSVSSPRSSTTASLRKVFQSQMENKSSGPVVSKKPALPPPPPTTKKPPTAKSSSTSSLSKTLSGIKSMLNSEQNATDKVKHVAAEINDSKAYGSIAVKRSESVGSMKKTDFPDGSCMSKSSYHVTPSSGLESSPSSLVFTNVHIFYKYTISIYIIYQLIMLYGFFSTIIILLKLRVLILTK